MYPTHSRALKHAIRARRDSFISALGLGMPTWTGRVHATHARKLCPNMQYKQCLTVARLRLDGMHRCIQHTQALPFTHTHPQPPRHTPPTPTHPPTHPPTTHASYSPPDIVALGDAAGRLGVGMAARLALVQSLPGHTHKRTHTSTPTGARTHAHTRTCLTYLIYSTRRCRARRRRERTGCRQHRAACPRAITPGQAALCARCEAPAVRDLQSQHPE